MQEVELIRDDNGLKVICQTEVNYEATEKSRVVNKDIGLIKSYVIDHLNRLKSIEEIKSIISNLLKQITRPRQVHW